MVKKGQNIDHVVIECPLLPHNIKRKAFVSFYMRHFSFFVLLFCQETRDVQKKILLCTSLSDIKKKITPHTRRFDSNVSHNSKSNSKFRLSWLQILQIVENSTLLYLLLFDTHDITVYYDSKLLASVM